jgi:protein tyrosine/serine phosphatase
MLNLRQGLRGTHKTKILGRLFICAGAALAAAIIVPAAYVAFLGLSGNFHTVVDGSIYRSAQPSDSALQHYARTKGIRSVLNLRSLDASRDTERQAAEHLGLSYFRVPLSAVRMPAADELVAIKKILAEAPKPILVHSYFGADRAGLVSALYLLLIDDTSLRKAKEQLSLAYGHLDFPGNPAVAMDQTFEAVASIYRSSDAEKAGHASELNSKKAF